jgi:SAM-dependent methyltransferase
VAFEINGIRFLLAAKASGVSFEKVVMLGRQALAIQPELLRATLHSFGRDVGDGELRRLFSAGQGYAEPFLELLGARSISSIDASPFEGATLTHDMNQPIPLALRGAFDTVIDGGCLEHIFDLPRALRNCMEMVRVGGHFVSIAPANNCMGHGFYQFSPELFFRVLSPENGYRVEQIVACEIDQDAEWYEVRDPGRTNERIEVVNSHPTYLLVRAQRTADVALLEATPQQSDYAASWQRSEDPEARPAPEPSAFRPEHGPLRRWLSRVTPDSLKRRYRRLWATTGAPYRRAGYKRVESPQGR